MVLDGKYVKCQASVPLSDNYSELQELLLVPNVKLYPCAATTSKFDCNCKIVEALPSDQTTNLGLWPVQNWDKQQWVWRFLLQDWRHKNGEVQLSVVAATFNKIKLITLLNIDSVAQMGQWVGSTLWTFPQKVDTHWKYWCTWFIFSRKPRCKGKI